MNKIGLENMKCMVELMSSANDNLISSYVDNSSMRNIMKRCGKKFRSTC